MSPCEDIEKFGKGIGNASRYAIVEELLKGSKTVSEIVAAVHQSQPAVSQHLKTLKETGLVSDERKGQTIHYSLNTEHMLKLLTTLSKDVQKCKKFSVKN
jgi:DNA-binding transcriptional ArsR family regulator